VNEQRTYFRRYYSTEEFHGIKQNINYDYLHDRIHYGRKRQHTVQKENIAQEGGWLLMEWFYSTEKRKLLNGNFKKRTTID